LIPPGWLDFCVKISIIGLDLSPDRRLMLFKEAMRYTPRFRFQVVMETFKSSKSLGQIVKTLAIDIKDLSE
jgi:hypothetical protein